MSLFKSHVCDEVSMCPPRIVTNDLYFAAYLLSRGKELEKTYSNGRRRVSFVVKGEDVKELKQLYYSGAVSLNVRTFQENLKNIRKLIAHEQRSKPCPYPKRLSPA